jgi:P-type Ca2+ transporter type 2C
VGEELSSGTVVTRGRAVATVVRTGADSGLGRIAELIAAAGG